MLKLLVTIGVLYALITWLLFPMITRIVTSIASHFAWMLP